MTRRVFVGLGSNLGDRWGYLRTAVAALPDVTAVSSVYETAPVEVPDKQGMYLNAVVQLDSDIEAEELLKLTRKIEADNGRVRGDFHAARTLDIDILLVGNEVHQTPELEVPHPRMWARRFVVEPLAELAPDLVPPNWLDVVTGDVKRAGNINS